MGLELSPKDFPSLPFQFHPCSTGKALNLLVLFHGLGDHEANFLKLGKNLNLPQTSVVAIRAPYGVPFLDEPAFMWWDSFDLSTGEEKIPSQRDPSFQRALSLVVDFLDFVRSKGWQSEGIFLMGFSQGGTMALETGFASPHKLGGILSMSGFPISSSNNKLSDRIPKKAFELPILITLGDSDPNVTVPLASRKLDEIKNVFKTRNDNINLEVISNKGHTMSHRKDETLVWMKFFGRHLILSNPEIEKMADVYEVVQNTS